MKNETKVLNSNSVNLVSNNTDESIKYKSKKEIDICSDKSAKKNEEVEVIIDATDLFGKCRVVADSIETYNEKELIDKNVDIVLSKDETFYFDRLHTTNKGNVYVSWGDFNGKRIYAPYKNASDEYSSVVRIST